MTSTQEWQNQTDCITLISVAPHLKHSSFRFIFWLRFLIGSLFACAPKCANSFLENFPIVQLEINQYSTNTDLFSRVLFLFAPFAGHPSSSPFLGTFAPFSPPPQKVLCSVERRARRRAWRGAVSGWTSPQSSGRKYLPEICVKKKGFESVIKNQRTQVL